MKKPILLGLAALLIVALGASVAYFRARLPPDCTDPRTIALVRQSLTSRFHLPASTQLETIRTTAGGALALRFVCVALLTGIDPNALPPGTPIPGEVHYTSQLTADGTRHEVSVTLDPLLIWEKVQ